MPAVPSPASADRLFDDRRDALAVDVLHREHVHARVADRDLLALVEIPDADEHRLRRRTFGDEPPMRASSAGSGPSSAASGMPCTLPLGDVAGVFMSPCASIQSRPIGSCLRASAPTSADAPTDPAARLWSPPSTSGSAPSASDAQRAVVEPLADLRDVADVLLPLVAPLAAFPESAPADRPCRRRGSRGRRGARRGRRCEAPTAPCPRRGGCRRGRGARR